MENEALFRNVAGAVLGTGFAGACVFRIRARLARGPVSRSGEGVWILLGLRIPSTICVAALIAYFAAPEWIAWSTFPVADGWRWFGIALAGASLVSVLWTFWHLGLNVTDTVATTDEQTLVTTGPYRWIRHPLYVLTAPFFVGISLMTTSALFVGFYAVAIVFLVMRTPIEERELIARFGDAYRDYMARTGRYFPRLG